MPWAFAGLVILGLALAASSLYRKGLLGGTAIDTLPPARDTAAAARVDSQVNFDSTALTPSFAGLDSLPIDTTTPHRTVTPPAPAPVVETIGADSGSLRLLNLPRGSQVLIDSRQATQPGVQMQLRAGWHELAVTASGYEFFTDSVKIEPALNPTFRKRTPSRRRRQPQLWRTPLSEYLPQFVHHQIRSMQVPIKLAPRFLRRPARLLLRFHASALAKFTTFPARFGAMANQRRASAGLTSSR